ncbi:MAG: hypothetical protein F6K54_40310 [Okeania sp. SIO3B5]|uniref:hypothetical protein n=1 Tax=Okeania sp. SIO3B5 TaxID=2607811 RepID=UPI0013FEB999|nr:hypothetical protein [Okeania sp. SIO3B5]NEO58734.1 hypothetical protein [Okeania sp. SIO3B5]
MRIYLYILSGITSSLIGWSIGQFILSDLGWLQKLPELALFPCVAISLAVGIVATDIFLSNPTRFKRNFNRGIIPLSIAAGLGLLIGLTSGALVQILLNPQLRDKVITVPDKFVRIVGWILIGGAVGLAEGLTWRWRSIEAGDKRRFLQRLTISLTTSILTALIAAIIFEWIRQQMNGIPTALQAWEDTIGFSLLGGLLGLVLSFSTSPSHLVALRAGAGFEYIENVNFNQSETPGNYPHIQKELSPRIKFVSNDLVDKIEEGLSIQLPARGKVKIGSAQLKIMGSQQFGVDICIPGLPLHIADLDLASSQTILVPNLKFFNRIEYQGEPLKESTPIKLKHNDLIAFYAENEGYNGKKLFRFVYYNRFLDPQS